MVFKSANDINTMFANGTKNVNVTYRNISVGVPDIVNDELRVQLLPVVIYLVVVMVTGILGNSAVCFIYKSQLTEKTSKFFIVYLACLDLISCCLCIPFEITDVMLAYTFTSTTACKLFRFAITWLQALSGLTLVSVAYARYRKIYNPFKDLGQRIKICCGVSVIVALIIAIPALFIFGTKTVQTHVSGIEGTECSANDVIDKSSVRLVYYSSLLFTFAFTLCCFLTFYVLIGVYILRRNKSQIGDGFHQNSGRLHNLNSTRAHDEVGEEPLSPQISCSRCVFKSSIQKQNSLKVGQLRLKTGRMTMIFLAVTISFVLSFLPFLIVSILRSLELHFVSNQNMSETLIYNLCVRSPYTNSAMNPVIYSVLNQNFRRDCVTKIFCRSSRK